MAGVVLAPASVTVAPGGDAVCTVTVRNSSTVVESYNITVLGDAAAWATPTPASISLFPGTDGTCVIHFRPPRDASLLAGTIDFAVRIAATQNADDTTVEEGTVTVEPFANIAARVTPRTSEAKRRARHVVSIDNRGNAPITVSVSASDPDEALAFDTEPPTVTIEPGESVATTVKVATRSGVLRGPVQHHPFQVTVTPAPESAHPPVGLDATLMQKPGMPKFVPVLAAVAVIALIAAVMIPALAKSREKGGTFSLTGANATPTTAAPAGGGDDAGDADAEVEAEVEVKEEKPDPVVTTAPARTTPTIAPASAGTKSVATTEKPVTTDPPNSTPPTTAAPVGTSTSTTSTTAPPAIHSQGTGLLHGTYMFDFDAGAETESGADCWWRQQTYTERYLDPRNGATFSILGKPNFDSVTLAQLKAAPYSAASLNGSDGADQLTVGTVIAVKTNAGRYAKVRVEVRNVSDPSRYSIQNMQLRWVTYA